EERPQEYRSSAAVSDELVIVNSQFKQVDAISVATGKRQWRHTLRRRADASPIIAGADVWIAATDGRLVRLSLKDGSEKWTYEIRGSFLASPAIAGDRLFIADDDGVIRCFGAAKSVQIEG
ncbi:MAG: PQQ-binding-like beta-propeller repeat protein, partial [Planctomycetaceae bacterium]|nr:PQQ-binding-like beta-propeller repeat protein [Planctomycetaceae bacterium]